MKIYLNNKKLRYWIWRKFSRFGFYSRWEEFLNATIYDMWLDWNDDDEL